MKKKIQQFKERIIDKFLEAEKQTFNWGCNEECQKGAIFQTYHYHTPACGKHERSEQEEKQMIEKIKIAVVNEINTYLYQNEIEELKMTQFVTEQAIQSQRLEKEILMQKIKILQGKERKNHKIEKIEQKQIKIAEQKQKNLKVHSLQVNLKILDEFCPKREKTTLAQPHRQRENLKNNLSNIFQLQKVWKQLKQQNKSKNAKYKIIKAIDKFWKEKNIVTNSP